MKNILSIIAAVGVFVMLIGAGCADSESIAPTIVLMSIGSIVTILSLLGLKAGDLSDYRK